MDKTKKERLWEIDFLRGIAIIMMITYHIIFDLYFLDILDMDLHSIPMRIFLYPIGTTFLLLVGVSLTLSYSRVKNTISEKKIYLKFIKRGIMIFCLGLVITAVTFFYLGSGFIIFGVLHCIGVCIILSIPFLNYKSFNLYLGLILILIGIILRNLVFDFPYLLWLGFIPKEFYTLDYFPILPWFGVVLLGIAIGNYAYPNAKRRYFLVDLSKNSLLKPLCFFGRHSLIIYLLHQPILLGIIFLFFM